MGDSSRRSVYTDEAPAAIGPYSQGMVSRGLIHTAGQIGLDPDTGELVGPGVAEQTRQVMDNLEAVLAAAGAEMTDVVKTTIFLADMDDFGTVNEIYGGRVGEPYPARSTVEVGRLPGDARVEIEAIARAPDASG